SYSLEDTFATACNEFYWHHTGSNYTASTVDSVILTGAAAGGCDSVVKLYLTINDTVVTIVNDTACGSYIFAGDTLTASGIYYDTLYTIANCDSVIALYLVINKNDTTTIDTAVCESYVFAGNTLTASGQYFDTLATEAGCDSLIVLNLTINKND